MSDTPSLPRAYTVDDIDAMRSATEIIWACRRRWTIGGNAHRAEIEDHLRTYIAAGISADELRAAAHDAMAESNKEEDRDA